MRRRPFCRTRAGQSSSALERERVAFGSAPGSSSSARDPRSVAWSRCESRDSITSLGTGSEPATRSIRTGEVDEADEATLVEARGAIVASARSSSIGTGRFRDRRRQRAVAGHPVGCPARRPRTARCRQHGSKWWRPRPGNEPIEAGRGIPDLAACGLRGAGHRARHRWRIRGLRGWRVRWLGEWRVRRSGGRPDRLARRPGHRRPLPAPDRRDPRRRSVEGDAGRRAAVGRKPASSRCTPRRHFSSRG